MSLANNNQKVIKKITKRSLKTNKVRNIFAVLAIMLTTFMISSVFSIGMSFIKNYEIMNTRLAGTTANSVLTYPTEKQLTQINDMSDFASVGLQLNVGKVDMAQMKSSKKKIQVEYHDAKDFNQQLMPALDDVTGTYPKKEQEVMASRLALDILGYQESKIGDTIQVPIKMDEEIRMETFKISGIFTSFSLSQDMGYLFVSQDFTTKYGLTVEKNGFVSMKAKNSAKSTIQETLKKDLELTDKQDLSFNFDTSDLESTNTGTILLVVIIVGFIVLSGYLLIYNIFYIAVTKDINFYGLLKTIGTSPKQIKKIVKGQANQLSLIGIPLGLILGAFVSFVMVPAMMSTFFTGAQSELMPREVSFNPLIFIVSIIFSMFTVMISCHKPAKIAASISPVEALNYTGAPPKRQRNIRKTTKGGKLYKMGWYNVFRDKKRAFLVIISLFMGSLTFLSVTTFIDSMKVENYIKRYVPHDFELQNVGIETERFSDELVEDVKEINGVTSFDVLTASEMRLTMNENVILPALKEGYSRFDISEDELKAFIEGIKDNPENMNANVIGIDDQFIDKMAKDAEDPFDVTAFKNGELVLISKWYYGKDYQKINGNLEIFNPENGIHKDFEAKVVGFKDNLPDGAPRAAGIPTIYMSAKALKQMDAKTVNYMAFIDVKPRYEPQIKKELKELEANTGMVLSSKSTTAEEFKQSMMVYRIMGGGISLILILIGLLNFVNVMITGVNARLKELAVMESIGMTKKQIQKMLMYEGLYYAMIESALILTVGFGIVYGIAQLAQNIADYATFSFPLLPMVVLIVLIFVICLGTPALVYRSSVKQSITERIREIEK